MVLKDLNLQQNLISEIPKTIMNLNRLLILNLSYNRLSEIPNELSELVLLRELLLCGKNTMQFIVMCVGNRIVKISASISKLQKLETIDVSSNRIESIFPGIYLLFLSQLILRDLYALWA